MCIETGQGGPAAELHWRVGAQPATGAPGRRRAPRRVPRSTFAEYDQWYKRLNDLGVPSSGPVDRFYFRSLYFREPEAFL